MPIALCSPAEYVDMLHSLPIAGYTGFPGGIVSITRYVSGNREFDKNTLAPDLYAIMLRIAKGKPEQVFTTFDGFKRIPSGQGGYADFFTALDLINRYQGEFRKEKRLAEYFKSADFLQAICDAGGLGLDCIGFCGTYMEVAGLQANYVGRRPLDYASVFKPVQSLDDVRPYGVLMLTNGKHIQFIESVDRISSTELKLTICQSSSGGPQTNVGVRLKSGGGDYLPVEEFRRARDSKSRMNEYNRDKQGGEDYEGYLRRTMTKKNYQGLGYGNGAIFTLTGTSEPKNPVSGFVYAGVHPAGVSIRTP